MENDDYTNDEVNDTQNEFLNSAESAETAAAEAGESFAAESAEEIAENTESPEDAMDSVVDALDSESAIEQPSKKSKKPLMFIGAAVVIIAAICCGAYVFAQSPEKLLAKAKKTTQADFDAVAGNALFSKAPEYIELTQQTEANFSFTLKNVSSKQGMPLFFLNDSRLSGSINIDELTRRLDTDLSLDLRGEHVVGADLNLDGSLLSLNVPELFGQKYYSVELTELDPALVESIVPISDFSAEDITTALDGLFSFSGKINELNRAAYDNGSPVEKLAALQSDFARIIAEAEEGAEVTKGEDIQVGDVKCRAYETQYSGEIVKKLVQTAIDAYFDVVQNNIRTMQKTFPGVYDDFYAEYENQFSELRGRIDEIAFEPLTAGYAVDGKNIIRSSDYATAFTYNGERTEISVRITKNGENNIYDSLIANIDVKNGSDVLAAVITSEGAHASSSTFTDSSKIELTSFVLGSGESEQKVTITSDIGYDAPANETACEFSFESDSQPGIYTLGFKVKTENDPAAKISKATFESIYVESPVLDLLLAAEYSVSPATSRVKSRDNLDYSEILKLGSFELMGIYTEVYTNYQALSQKVLSMFGF